MKKLIFILAVSPFMAFAQLKFATVDFLLLVRNHPDYARNEKFLSTKSKDLQKKADAIKAEGEALQSEGKKLMEQFQNPMLNAKSKSELELKLQGIQKKLMEIEQRYRTEMLRGNDDLQADRVRMMKDTTDDLRARLKVFAEKEGYGIILDSNVTAYAKESLDVTDAILTQMGVDPAKARAEMKEADEGK